MFRKSIDNKKKYNISEDIEVVDLADGIFDSKYAMSQVCEIFKIPKSMEMRPDLVSKALYGSTDYTEMVLKYSLISNPFAVEKDDMVFSPSISSIYKPVKDVLEDPTETFSAIKNYHKYIDKDKVPSKSGSDPIALNIAPKTGSMSSVSGTGTAIQATDNEANISKEGNNGITVKDGKIFFGSVDESLSSVDSSIVDCAADGVTLGEFLNATIRQLSQ